MLRSSLRHVTIVACCLTLLLTSALRSQSQQYALLIAVENYEHRDLRTIRCAVDDARDLSKFLLDHGYSQVELLLDEEASQAAIRSKLDGLNRKGGGNGAVLLGLFGHGVELQDTKLSYFCPYDCRFTAKVLDADGKQLFKNDGTPLVGPDKESLISLNEIIAAVKTSPAKDRILIADCCREDPNAARSLFATSFTLDPNEPIAILLACQRGRRAFEFFDKKLQAGNGLLTKSLIAHWKDRLSEGSVKIADGMDQLKRRVGTLADELGESQEPLGFGSFSVDLQIRPIEPKLGEVMKIEGIGLELVWIRDESLGLWVGRTEVTQGQYSSVLSQSPWLETDKENAEQLKVGNEFPASCVTWDAARRFCEALTRTERQAGRLAKNESYRLPQSKEWTTIAQLVQGKQAASKLAQIAWYEENALALDEAFAHPVSTKQSLRFGIVDLFGNVFEWCGDQAINNRFHPVMGGSFKSAADTCLQMKPSRLNFEFADATIGFRIVRGPDPQ